MPDDMAAQCREYGEQRTHCGSVSYLVKGGHAGVCTLFPFPDSLGSPSPRP
ncbi:hypothetical protein K438DRAFT_1824733 [Mycena galopus ATCC 62051]|nr:hypothetical protein K438DRAFT_1824733 [Mycena galopus ATCC 62051]